MKTRNIVFIIFLFTTFFIGSQCNKNNINKEPVKIGILFSKSGNLAPYGEKAFEGYELAREDLFSQGIKIDFIIEDTKSTSKDAINGFHKLVSSDKVQIVIGPEASGLALAIAPIANENKVVLFAPTISADKFSTPNDYTFRNWPSSKLISEKAALVAHKLGYNSIAILTINNDMGASYSIDFKNKFESLGGKVVFNDNYKIDESNFSSQLLNLRKSNPDAIYLVGQVEMGQILKQMRELNFTIPIISGIGIEDPKVKEIAGDNINGIIYTTPSYNPNSNQSVVRKYEEDFEKKYNKKSEIFAACTYDAVMIIGKLISEGNITSDKIKEALFKMQNYDGVSGKINIDNNGDVIKDISIKKIIDGKFVFLNDSLQLIQ